LLTNFDKTPDGGITFREIAEKIGDRITAHRQETTVPPIQSEKKGDVEVVGMDKSRRRCQSGQDEESRGARET
jgi:hypothetical protein